MNKAGESRARRILFGALKLAFAAVIVVLVVRAIPWRDALRHKGEERTQSFAGRILGDWKSERIRFELEPPVAREDLPAEWQLDGQQVEVERSASTSWQPGMPRMFRDVEPSGLALALSMFGIGLIATSMRWWRLLGAAGCPTRYWPALRLTAIGFFFNIVVPGLTGGDVIKAVLVARDHPERKAAAAISVLVDRLVGVLVLALLGAIAIVVVGERFAHLRVPVIAGLALAVLGAFAYGNQRLRKLLGFERWLAKLPFAATLRQIDEAATIYSRRPGEFALALLFSIVNQAAVMTAIGALARAFGDQALGPAGYVLVGSLGNLVGAITPTPGGIGGTEGTYGLLFEELGGAFEIGVAVSIGVRLCMITIGLLGGVFMLFPGARAAVREARQS